MAVAHSMAKLVAVSFAEELLRECRRVRVTVFAAQITPSWLVQAQTKSACVVIAVFRALCGWQPRESEVVATK